MCLYGLQVAVPVLAVIYLFIPVQPQVTSQKTY